MKNNQTTGNARHIAMEVLNEFEKTSRNIRDLLHRRLPDTDRKPLATDITYGVIRNRPTIDTVIEKTSGTLTKNIAPKLVNIIRIGVYELIYAPDTPAYALVSEAVNLARATAGKKQSAFTNALLRNITRAIEARSTDLRTAPARKTIPNSPTTGCLFTDDILPDPASNPARHLATAFSLPRWLIRQWLTEFGPEQTRHICFASNRRPAIYLQPNTLKISQAGLVELFEQNNIDCCPTHDHMIRLDTSLPINSLPGYEQGLFTAQDPTATNVPATINPQPGQTVLDLCAAPGGKTVRLAQLMNDTGQIIATDINPDRLKMVEQNRQRLGISCIRTVAYDSLDDHLRHLPPLDMVLLDVPCSNTAVLARRCEVRLRITPRAIDALAETQTKLLRKAADLIATPNARIAYSTCAITRQENQNTISAFIADNPDFTIDYDKLTTPATAAPQSHEHDGGYLAILKKT